MAEDEKNWIATIPPDGEKITIQDTALSAFMLLYPNAVIKAAITGVKLGRAVYETLKTKSPAQGGPNTAVTTVASPARGGDLTPWQPNPRKRDEWVFKDKNSRNLGDDEMGVTLTATGIGIQTWLQIRGNANNAEGFPGNSSRYVQWGAILGAAGKNLDSFLTPRYGRSFDGDQLEQIGAVMDDLDLHLAAGKLNDPRVSAPWNNLTIYGDTAEVEGFISSFIERPGGPRKRRSAPRRVFKKRRTTKK